MKTSSGIAANTLAVALAGMWGPAAGQDPSTRSGQAWPTKSVRLVVPFAATSASFEERLGNEYAALAPLVQSIGMTLQ
jgi:hypothetical protein